MLTDTLIRPAPLETKSADAPSRPAPTLRARRYRPRRTIADRVREALITLSEGRASVLSHEEKAWASITFAGTRHEMMLDFDGKEAVEVGEEFIANLPEHEFHIPGQLVAEATIREVDHRFNGDDERMVVTAVLLLLEES
ncbi:hypothetical protein [Erythrobacter sp. F6033]|uniref:hypothetical protein n=1 Tax=Erythrobacter sp. F6033 TaxID=2926401 RepID=UPI001FF38FF8|nr:hypothetical protein [Erythrobacter sp. F6033]MCK0127900.1 hypothetical protein [Erythrobacter sp. F6033]